DRDIDQLEGRDGADDGKSHGVEAALRLDQPALAPRPPATTRASTDHQHHEAQHDRLTPQRAARLAHRSALLATVVVAPMAGWVASLRLHAGCLAWSIIQVI